MNHPSLNKLMNEAALKFAGQAGTKEAPRSSAIPNQVANTLKPFISFMSPIKTDVRHVSYGSRTPIISDVDPLGNEIRGDHKSLSALFTSDPTIRSFVNITRDVADQNVGGTYQSISQRAKEGKLNSSLLLSIITPGGSVRETDGYYRRSGLEQGSAYFSISFVNKKLSKKEWEKVKIIIEHIYLTESEKTSVRGAFLDYGNRNVPTAFSITKDKQTEIQVCDDREKNNRQVNLEELIANLDNVFATSNADVNFYLAGSFDI